MRRTSEDPGPPDGGCLLDGRTSGARRATHWGNGRLRPQRIPGRSAGTWCRPRTCEGIGGARVGGPWGAIDFEGSAAVVPWLAKRRVLSPGVDEAFSLLPVRLPLTARDRDYTVQYRWMRFAFGRRSIGDTRPQCYGSASRRTVRRDRRARLLHLEPLPPEVTWVSYVMHAELGGLLPRRMKEQAAWKVPLRILSPFVTASPPSGPRRLAVRRPLSRALRRRIEHRRPRSVIHTATLAQEAPHR